MKIPLCTFIRQHFEACTLRLTNKNSNEELIITKSKVEECTLACLISVQFLLNVHSGILIVESERTGLKMLPNKRT